MPAWLTRPTAHEHLFGASGSVHLLVLGVVGFVVAGTLYHIIPFIIWVHRYSDRLGLEEVPMIDDLYDDRLAATDFVCFVSGTALLVVADMLLESVFLTGLGGVLVTLGVVVFTANMFLVVHNHGPQSLPRVVFGPVLGRRDQSEQEQAAMEE
jgi:cbb3-type cytochrome oxidase subunit 1